MPEDPMIPSTRCVDLIKMFEGCTLTAKLDENGNYEIGWGHNGAKEGDIIVQFRADELLLEDIASAGRTISSLVKVDLSQNEFDALCSLVYNIGENAFKESTMLKYINHYHFNDAANEFLKWNHVNGKVIEGLSARRSAEQELFLADSLLADTDA